MARTRTCTAAERRGRLLKARQFLRAADRMAEDGTKDIADAYITLCIHAGIAAADVVCCARLGEHASGEHHGEAVALLGKVDRSLAKDLSALLSMKTAVGYGATGSSATDAKRAGRSVRRLVEAAITV